MWVMVLINKTPLAAHRSGITAADSGNDPSTWSDAPSAITDMANGRVLRLYPRASSGTISAYVITPITINGSVTQVHAAFTKSSNTTEPVDFEGLSGEERLYIRIDSITGGGTMVIEYSVVNF